MPKCISPLRYPGGKAKLYRKVSELIKNNFDVKPIYCEPFAGGFGLGISLLLNGDISSAIINDFDYCIYAFWKCVVDEALHDNFVEMIRSTEVTIEEWRKQKEIYKNYDCYSVLQVGFSTFFLNRCNRSGILSANPIGGINQTGKYSIDCRFNKETLINQIEKIYSYRNRITVYNKDAVTLIPEIDTMNNVLFNIDPPYIKAGPLLYKNNYDAEDHKKLGEEVKQLKNKWIMTYDNNPLVYEIYNGFNIRLYNLSYSLENKHKAEEIMILSPSMK